MSKKIYISYPFRGENLAKVNENIIDAECYGNFVKNYYGWEPIVVHTQIDEIWGAERANSDPNVDPDIVKFNLKLLKDCDRMFVCGGRISKGMQEEIAFCREHKIPMQRVIIEPYA